MLLITEGLNGYVRKINGFQLFSSVCTEDWVSEHLHDLNLATLLEETPSPNIHVWMTGADGTIESFETDDVNTALVCHNAGRASLYFRAPQVMADEVVKELSHDLGKFRISRLATIKRAA